MSLQQKKTLMGRPELASAWTNVGVPISMASHFIEVPPHPAPLRSLRLLFCLPPPRLISSLPNLKTRGRPSATTSGATRCRATSPARSRTSSACSRPSRRPTSAAPCRRYQPSSSRSPNGKTRRGDNSKHRRLGGIDSKAWRTGDSSTGK